MTSKKIDHYGGYSARQLSLDKLKTIFSDLGVDRLLLKRLSPNDNSKNQPYFGSDYSALNLIPSGEIRVHESISRKKTGGPNKTIFKAPLNLTWVDADGGLHPAKNAQLIMYPQYPEVRFSGFLKGSSINMSEWMLPERQGRIEGRFLMLGICDAGKIFAYLAVPNTNLSRELEVTDQSKQYGVFIELAGYEKNRDWKTRDLFDAVADTPRGPAGQPKEAFVDTRFLLLEALRKIHSKGWIKSKRLDADRNILPCNSSNCGGYTLEAELGVTPNGYSEPDYLGWEIKQYGVDKFSRIDGRVVTLMTPEPTGGIYKDEGVEKFIRSFGYEDLRGRQDRLNFGGIHKTGITHKRTNVVLMLEGFDGEKKKITDANGGIVLKAEDDTIAAKWHFAGLLEHWKRKHNQAAYIPSLSLKQPRKYSYGNMIKLGEGADVTNLLSCFAEGIIYYDPGIKMEDASTSKPKIKRRSQFRIKTGDIEKLYKSMEIVDLNKL